VFPSSLTLQEEGALGELFMEAVDESEIRFSRKYLERRPFDCKEDSRKTRLAFVQVVVCGRASSGSHGEAKGGLERFPDLLFKRKRCSQ
jgi:hypothetical protein